MLIFAIISISCALLFYTAGVFGGKLAGVLKPRHVALFWMGLVCDATGTVLMSINAHAALSVSFHSVTGAAAILLMAVNAVWATVTLRKGSAEQKRRFHRFSLVIWTIWLVPYLSGMIFAMAR
jgi:uncharacterized repeat protein (TIGR03987 family)